MKIYKGEEREVIRKMIYQKEKQECTELIKGTKIIEERKREDEQDESEECGRAMWKNLCGTRKRVRGA